jgi:hypothetical protein
VEAKNAETTPGEAMRSKKWLAPIAMLVRGKSE